MVHNYKGSKRPPYILPEYWRMMGASERSREVTIHQAQLEQDFAEEQATTDALPADIAPAESRYPCAEQIVQVAGHDSCAEQAKMPGGSWVYPLELREDMDIDCDIIEAGRVTRIHNGPRTFLYTPTERKLRKWGFGIPGNPPARACISGIC